MRKRPCPSRCGAAAFAGVLALIAIANRPDGAPQAGAAEPATKPADASWVMFRGGQGLLGFAPGKLPDRLNLLWRYKTRDAVRSSPAVVNGRVYVASMDGTVYALDQATGKRLWSHNVGDVVDSSALVLDGMVYLGCEDGVLYALSAETGKVQWKCPTDQKITGSPNWTVSADGKSKWILVTSYDATLRCLRAKDGKEVWTYLSDERINGGAAVADGMATFGGCDQAVHVVRLSDGKGLQVLGANSYILSSPAFVDGKVYIGDHEGGFFCGDVKTGKTVWSFDTEGGDQATFAATAAVDAERVVIGSRDGNVYCLDRKTGKKRWVFTAGGGIDSSVVICGDKAVFGSDDGRLYMVRLATGKEVWQYRALDPIASSPAVVGGMVIVGSDDGYVYAFGSPGK